MSFSSQTDTSDVIKDLRICFLAGTLGKGGAERQLFYLLRSLRDVGSSTTVLNLTRNESWEEPIRRLGVEVVWVGQSGSRLARLFRIIRETGKRKPHILQSQHFYTNIYVALAAYAGNVLDIGASRNAICQEIAANGFPFGRLCVTLPRVLIANSRASVEIATSKRGAAKGVYYLANVVDTEEFRPVSKVLSKPKVSILGVGRLVQQKRFDRFLRVLAIANNRNKGSFEAVIVGNGPLRLELETQAQSLGLTPDVLRFLGVKERMPDVYASADMLFSSSDWEGNSNVILEAMACGLPVVATRVGEAEQLIENGLNGFLVDRTDEGGLTEAVETLLRRADLRLSFSKASRTNAVNQHSLSTLPTRVRELYTRIRREHRGTIRL
ncbi:MAG TPA: glycosyltransferase [Clostridia bacterium]|nr:glycosyltransferase [Clostridia bacterium]